MNLFQKICLIAAILFFSSLIGDLTATYLSPALAGIICVGLGGLGVHLYHTRE